MQKLIIAILLLFAINAHAFSVGLAWDANTESDLSGYKVYHSTVNVKPFTLVGSTSLTTYTVPNMESGVAHYFAVTAYNSTAESEYSNIVYLLIPNAPTRVEVILNSLTVNSINKITIKPE